MASGLWQWRGGIQAAGLLQLSSIETSVSTGVGPKVDGVGVEGVGTNSGCASAQPEYLCGKSWRDLQGSVAAVLDIDNFIRSEVG